MLFERLRLAPSVICEPSIADKDLAVKSVSASVATVSSQAALFLIQLGSTAVLARLLRPADFGVFAMALVVLKFAQMFSNFGLSAATIQRKTISREQLSSLFWVNAGMAVLLAILVAAISPLVSRLFNNPALRPITATLSLSLILNGVAVQHGAVLRRHVRFAGIALATVLGQVIGAGVSIVLATQGFGYWALVIGPLAAALTCSLVIFLLCPWRPGRFDRNSGVRQMLSFGANVTVFEFVNYFSRNLDNILIGRYLGADPLAYYSKAYSLFMTPMAQIRTPLTQVAMPVFSSLQDDPGRYTRYFAFLTNTLATLIVPLAALVFIEADFFVAVLLGSQWAAVVPLLRLLAVAGLVQGVVSTPAIAMLSMGQSGRYMRFGIARALVICAAFIIGLPYGAAGVAAAFAIAHYALFLPSLFYCLKGTPISVGQFLRTLPLPIILSGVAGGLAYLARHLIGYDTTGGSIAAIAVFGLTYVATSSFRPVARDMFHRTISAISARRSSHD